ncbi:MAG: CBS and ACT domain-containing protein [Desulfobacterales bacterium]|nr:CBS and ACT domain-containing protein [Desulfobacterales bacterium]MDX2513047.1 CBS and ACT domain-containing protein [Desulfobacterales bacterium]
MFVSRSMTVKVITIQPDATVLDAQKMMATHQIRHLPVIDGQDRLIGVVTDRDVRSILPYDCYKDPDCSKEQEKLAGLTIKNIMTVEPLTISPSDTIQDALLLIQIKRVGAFPVVDDTGKLKGIISVRDLLRAFTNVLGIGEPGTLLCILVEEKIGQMKEIVDAITEEGISFGSILVARYWEEDKRAVFPYLLTQNISRVKKKLQAMGFTLLEPMDWYLDQLPKHE